MGRYGLVMEVHANEAVVLMPDGEFRRQPIDGEVPEVGDLMQVTEEPPTLTLTKKAEQDGEPLG
ncbi:anti-sigma factor domain-containing protein [Heliophilum fasciatum]|uniref:anti-sigma factor domain-containing protein n=1 Tax=Heliophilum fasciatum TaxID=35700 RepID=UPI0014055544|nr:anti-sigma factor domain-containing protein [Heliophilum fasciatum]MCW2278067.1 hypothetical protein [Heliophilum fasciatum]